MRRESQSLGGNLICKHERLEVVIRLWLMLNDAESDFFVEIYHKWITSNDLFKRRDCVRRICEWGDAMNSQIKGCLRVELLHSLHQGASNPLIPLFRVHAHIAYE